MSLGYLKNSQKKVNEKDALGDESQTVLSIQDPSKYTPEDKDWPIVQTEKYTYLDKETGLLHEHVTIWRESPPGYIPSSEQLSSCPKIVISAVTKSNSTPDACTSVGYVSRNDVDTITFSGTSVSHYITHYAEKFCEGGCSNRVLYRPHQVSRSWTRTSTNWTVQNATMQWGCDAACIKCDGSNWSWVYSWGPVTVSWSNNTQSYVYISTNNSLPAVQGLFDQVVKAVSRSDAYYSGSKKGSTYVNAGYP